MYKLDHLTIITTTLLGLPLTSSSHVTYGALEQRYVLDMSFDAENTQNLKTRPILTPRDITYRILVVESR